MAPVIINKFKRLSDRRFARYVAEGVRLVNEGMSFRNAAAQAHLLTSTLHYHYHKDNNEPITRANARMSLTRAEENRIVDILLAHSRRGRPLTRKDLQDCVQMLVTTFSTHRKERLRFNNGRPGRRFCELFEARHSHRIALKQPSLQEAKRYYATNAKVLVHHMTAIKKLIDHYQIAPTNIVNVDETGFSTLQSRRVGRLRRRYVERNERPLVPTPEFKNVNHITVLGTVFADGRVGIPMVIFQGTKLRVRRITRSGDQNAVPQCITQCLPSNAVVTARKDIASVDSANFFEWAKHFITDTEPLRMDNRRVLLIYDGHRSHLSIPVLELLAQNNIIAYALPAHTSGTTQPLDVGVFPSMKHNFRELLEQVYRERRRDRVPIDEFDVAQIIRSSYEKSFSVKNVQAGFRKTGIFPFNDCRLFSQARPYSFEEPNRIASLDEMLQMMEEEGKKSVEEIIEDVHLHSSGFLDTSYGAVLTTDAALSLLRLSEQTRDLAKNKSQATAAENENKRAIERKRRQVLRRHYERVDALRRSRQFGEAFVMPKSLRVRRAVAKSRVQASRAARLQTLSGSVAVDGC